ncbi:MAG: DUF1015 family protein [Oscillospiraceae bacterium]|nr:DUF1015 family protein [Oscillospiraceae bacterium]
MAIVRPFCAIRPKKEIAEKLSCLPYDVMNRSEAKEMAEGNEYSYLHVVRSEIDFDDSQNPYDEIIYKKARENLDSFIENGILAKDEKPMFYIYRQIMNGRVQTGIVAITSVDEYVNGNIKRHEFTRPDKEVDRINNFYYCDANTEPIFLTYRNNVKINKLINDFIKFHNPTYNFTSEDGITHIFWPIDDDKINDELHVLFNGVDYLYIADGHHRTASSAKVSLKKREENKDYKGDEEFNFFMSVIFPDEDIFIMDYNRVVKDLNGLTSEEFLNKVKEKFDVNELNLNEPYKPTEKHTFGMYLDDKWYSLSAKPDSFDENDVIGRLDVSILQNNLLNPILGIKDPRTDKRIDFVGGIRGIKGLEDRCHKDMKVAFSMYPTTIDDLLSIADANEIMPPKSTWFEPKLRSGLFIHRLS